MMKDVYWYLDTFNSDSIPISEWLFMQRYTDEGYQIERLYQKRLDRKTEFLFLIDTYVSDSINYKFSILMRTKEKKYK